MIRICGRSKRCRAPTKLPRNPPAPAAAPTTPSRISWSPGAPGVSFFTTNAENSMRKPVRLRIVPFAQRAVTTSRPIGARRGSGSRPGIGSSVVGTSPSVTSTHAGIRRQSHTAARQITAVSHAAPGEPNEPGDPGRDRPGDPGRDEPEDREPGVGGHERDAGREHARGHGRLEHAERLRQHHDPECRRVEHPGVHPQREHDGEHALAGRRGRHRRAPALLEPVERGADDRGDERERGDGDEQVERDLALALGAGGGEEQGVGQRDGERRVGGVVRHPGVGQGGEPGAVGAVGGRGAVERLRAPLGQAPGPPGRDPRDRDLAGTGVVVGVPPSGGPGGGVAGVGVAGIRAGAGLLGERAGLPGRGGQPPGPARRRGTVRVVPGPRRRGGRRPVARVVAGRAPERSGHGSMMTDRAADRDTPVPAPGSGRGGRGSWPRTRTTPDARISHAGVTRPGTRPAMTTWPVPRGTWPRRR